MIVSLIVTVVGFAIWLWKRKVATDERPATAIKKYEDEARKLIASTADINASVDERLRAIARNSSGQRNIVAASGGDDLAQRLPRATGTDAGDSGRAGKA